MKKKVAAIILQKVIASKELKVTSIHPGKEYDNAILMGKDLLIVHTVSKGTYKKNQKVKISFS